MLVHGLGGAASNWLALAPLLLRAGGSSCPSCPATAAPTPLPAAPSLNAFADRLGLVVDHATGCPAAVVGHSLGGASRSGSRSARPELVERLVLAGAAGISSATRRSRYALTVTGLAQAGPADRRRIAGVWPRSACCERSSSGAGAPPTRRRSRRSVVDGFLAGPARHTDTFSAARALVRDDPRADLDRVRCPALVLWGARDNQLPVADAFDYARRLRAPVRLIADCGHLLIGERPDACADAIESFLAASS